jgi:hypothetical protein
MTLTKNRGENQPATEKENGMKMTVIQAAFLAKKADRLFKRAVSAWTRGNNSGNSNTLTRCEAQADGYRHQAETLLTPLGIVTHYSGLYPSFEVKGHQEYSTLNAISTALEAK